jgi:predicted permease
VGASVAPGDHAGRHACVERLLLLQAAMPPVTAAPIMVERAGGNVPFTGQLLLASYAASAATIPAAIWLFGRWAGA